MKVRVTRGTIKNNDTVYETGQTLELSDSEALSVIQAGVAEEAVEVEKVVAQEEKPKKKEKKEEVKEEAKLEVEPAEEEIKPSADWTRKELNEYAKAHGIEDPESFGSKPKLLEALGGETK